MKVSIYLFLTLMIVTNIFASDSLNPNPPVSPVRLVFIHHSVGEGWLTAGNLRQTLNNNNYYVTDTNYGWGPNIIGDRTDIGHWYEWFLGPSSNIYLKALYENDHITPGVGPNSISDPGGENTIVMFKSCFPNGHVVGGEPDDPPLPKKVDNPIYGEWSGSEHYTVENIKGLYRDLLDYFETRQDKLFVLITTPPSLEENIDAVQAERHRGICNWLVHEWLRDYPYNNAFAFDYYNVLTSNGGNPNTNDLNAETGNHHRYRNNEIQHVIGLDNNFLAYGLWGDDHPTAAGHLKATGEFISLLNIVYNIWQKKPKITISTDKDIYQLRDSMQINVHITNPIKVNLRVQIQIGLELPDGSIFPPSVIIANPTLPSGLDKTYTILNIQRLQAIPLGTYKCHARMLNSGGNIIISKDEAVWEFVGLRGSVANLMKLVPKFSIGNEVALSKQAFVPKSHILFQNVPNPFNPETWIPYQLKETADVKINIYDVSGRIVRSLELGQKKAGFYITKDKAAYWDGKDSLGQSVASGIYYYNISADNFSDTKSMLIVK